MTRNVFLTLLLQILVIGSGAFFSWNINFFQPYSVQLPAVNHYKKNSTQLLPDSVVAMAGKHYKRNAIGQFLLGKHYRSLWTLPLKLPVLHLGKAQGGLKILKRGGGMQTTSFTLANNSGKTFSLRSVDKDPINVLPRFLWPTFLAAFVRDQISATDPFAAQVVAELSDHAVIPHTKPELVFILPDNPVFNRFGVISGGVFNISAKFPEVKVFQKRGENFAGVFSSEQMLQKIDQAPGKAMIDTTLYLKCRLFDLFIGDWDRHAGQWDWLGFAAQNHTVFRPVPKDRDQALGHYQDGVLPFFLSRNFAVRKITSFTPEYEDTEGFSMNGRILDDRFLKRQTLSNFTAQARILKNLLTDKALQAAIEKYPPEVSTDAKEKVLKTLKKRRRHLTRAASEFYTIIQKRKVE